jgi:hypothetical protein
MRAQWGTYIPEGTGYGKLLADRPTGTDVINILYERVTHVEGGKIFVHLDAHSENLFTNP